MKRGGFSLVELLMVIAVVGMLAALVLTAIQSTRESARLVSCANNLRQLGTGLLLHHEAHGVLPPSWGGPDSTSTAVWGTPPKPAPYPGPGMGLASGFTMLLPYISQVDLFNAIEEAGWPHVQQAVYVHARIPTLLCPSDFGPASHNYQFSIGDSFSGFDPGFMPPPAENVLFQSRLRGLFGLQSRVRLSSVRDGLSHTIALSECVIPSGLGRHVTPGSEADGVNYSSELGEAVAKDRFAVVAMGAGLDRPRDCLDHVKAGTFVPGTVLLTLDRSPGFLWSYGRPSTISFSTVLPPNSPRCSDYTKQGCLTPLSRHPGGVAGLMADGSVRFISDGIDAGDPDAPQAVIGASTYGVWGALGSRDGSDVVPTLP